jgi:hypothetical protein
VRDTANATVDASEYMNYYDGLNIVQQMMVPHRENLNPSIAFEQRSSPCSQQVNYGVSWQTRVAGVPMMGNAVNSILTTLLELCYDCERCNGS